MLGVIRLAAVAVALGLRRTRVQSFWPDVLGPDGWRTAAVSTENERRVGAGVVRAIGFTVSSFFATAAFPPGPLLDQVKMGALLSFTAFPIALLAARLTKKKGDGKLA